MTDRSYIDTKQTIRNPVHNMNIICCYFHYYGKHFLTTIDVCKTAISLGISGQEIGVLRQVKPVHYVELEIVAQYVIYL